MHLLLYACRVQNYYSYGIFTFAFCMEIVLGFLRDETIFFTQVAIHTRNPTQINTFQII